MILCISIEYISAWFEILVPIALLYWFWYSQRDIYYKELLGIYAGYTNPIEESHDARKDAGIIMNIRDIVNNGFFRGEFDFRENISTLNDGNISSDGIYTFYGKMNYKIYLPKSRNPLNPKENRIYIGKLYIVDRLDFQFKVQKIEDFMVAEFEITHYHEMRVLEFKLIELKGDKKLNLPKAFTLFRTLGLHFEPYKNVKETIFRGFTRADAS